MRKIQRNDKCPCGSGKTYNYCCLEKESIAKDTKIMPPSVDQMILYKYFEEKHLDLNKELRIPVGCNYLV